MVHGDFLMYFHVMYVVIDLHKN